MSTSEQLGGIRLLDLSAAYVQERKASLEERGDRLLFYVTALAWTPRAILR